MSKINAFLSDDAVWKASCNDLKEYLKQDV